MNFFKKKNISYKGHHIPQDESYRISRTNRLVVMLIMVISGCSLSAAFPPLNWELLAFVSVAPLIMQSIKEPVSWKLFSCGYIWSLSWSFCAFFWLREINAFIPIGIAAIIGLWGGVYANLLSFVYRNTLRQEKQLAQNFQVREACDLPWYKTILFAALSGGLFILLEYIRINMFPWNYIGITQYKMLYLIQIVKFTGIYGVSFLLIAVNSIIAVGAWYLLEKSRNKKVNMHGVLIGAGFYAAIILLCCIYGFFSVCNAEKVPENGIKTRFGIVQGDISQRRVSTAKMAQEALDIYFDLSMKLADSKPDIIIWPETAVPYPFYGGHEVCANYRKKVYDIVSEKRVPLLIGTLDFVLAGNRKFEVTNSAFLINLSGSMQEKYSKIHRVPYGEFVPLRKYLPEKLAKALGMGRDLHPGNDASPLKILPDVRAGMAICYESIFASLARRETNLGANILIAINNDAWYPESSEPEQHVANAIFRCIENNIPSLRSGNNGASVFILPSGRISWQLSSHLLARERKTGIAEVILPRRIEPTFYTRYGDVFLLVMFVGTFTAIIYGIFQYFSVLSSMRKAKKEE